MSIVQDRRKCPMICLRVELREVKRSLLLWLLPFQPHASLTRLFVTITAVVLPIRSVLRSNPPLTSPGPSIEPAHREPENHGLSGLRYAAARDPLETVASVVPDVPRAQLKFLLQLSDGDCNAVSNYIFEGGLKLSSLLTLLRDFHLEESHVRRINLQEYGDSAVLAEEAIAFYKSGKFSPHAEIRIVIGDQPPHDVGGVRKQFLSDVFDHFTTSTGMRLFEGPKNRLRPVFRQTSISSGLLSLFGTMVGHSIIMDGQGFPSLSPACYFYMAGHVDRAMSVTSMADAGERVQYVASRVSAVALICLVYPNL